MVEVHGVLHRQGGVLPAAVPGPVVDRSAEGVAALAHDHLLHLQSQRSVPVQSFQTTRRVVVAREHPHVAVVPAVGGRHGPAEAGHLHDLGDVGQQLGEDLGLGGDDRVHDVGPLHVERDGGPLDLVAGVVLLPHQRVDPLVLLDPHLVAGRGMAVDGVLQVLRHDVQQVGDSPRHDCDQEGDIDAEGAVHTASAAAVALGVGDPGGLLDELGADFALAPQHLPHRVLDLAHR